MVEAEKYPANPTPHDALDVPSFWGSWRPLTDANTAIVNRLGPVSVPHPLTSASFGTSVPAWTGGVAAWNSALALTPFHSPATDLGTLRPSSANVSLLDNRDWSDWIGNTFGTFFSFSDGRLADMLRPYEDMFDDMNDALYDARIQSYRAWNDGRHTDFRLGRSTSSSTPSTRSIRWPAFPTSARPSATRTPTPSGRTSA